MSFLFSSFFLAVTGDYNKVIDNAEVKFDKVNVEERQTWPEGKWGGDSQREYEEKREQGRDREREREK